jgi:hypothetical protein
MLKSLGQQGIESANLPRWEQSKSKRNSKSNRVHLKKEHIEQLRIIYGEVAAWASSVQETFKDDDCFRCSGEHSTGDSYIGFISLKTQEYRIGRIRQILAIKLQPTSDKATSSEVIIFLVRVNKKAPKSFGSHLFDEVFQHSAIGMLIADTNEEEEDEVVTMDRLIGHVAIRALKSRRDEALLTVQLTKVSC